ncbi:MAG: sugar phosphate isomerase/epimerase family protein [Anaerovoracaceae bacterium]
MTTKAGICEWSMAASGPSAIAWAGKIGFDGIQLGDLGGSRNCFPLNDPVIQEEYLETSKKYNVLLHSLHLFTLVREGGLQCLPDSPEGKAALFSIEKGLEAAKSMGIPRLLVTSYDACSIVNDYDLECTAKLLRKACDMASHYGVQMVYEAVLGGHKIQEVLDYVGPDLKICFDSLNPTKFLRGDAVEEIRSFGTKWIDHVHLKDTPQNMKGFCQLGEGRGRYQECIDALREIGFDGWYITENFYHTPPMGNTGSLFVTAAKDLQTMRKI